MKSWGVGGIISRSATCWAGAGGLRWRGTGRRQGQPGSGGGRGGEAPAAPELRRGRRRERPSAVLMATGRISKHNLGAGGKAPEPRALGPRAASGKRSCAHIQPRRTPCKSRTCRKSPTPPPTRARVGTGSTCFNKGGSGFERPGSRMFTLPSQQVQKPRGGHGVQGWEAERAGE